jgi:hypothetical protein
LVEEGALRPSRNPGPIDAGTPGDSAAASTSAARPSGKPSAAPSSPSPTTRSRQRPSEF